MLGIISELLLVLLCVHHTELLLCLALVLLSEFLLLLPPILVLLQLPLVSYSLVFTVNTIPYLLRGRSHSRIFMSTARRPSDRRQGATGGRAYHYQE